MISGMYDRSHHVISSLRFISFLYGEGPVFSRSTIGSGSALSRQFSERWESEGKDFSENSRLLCRSGNGYYQGVVKTDGTFAPGTAVRAPQSPRACGRAPDACSAGSS